LWVFSIGWWAFAVWLADWTLQRFKFEAFAAITAIVSLLSLL